MLFYVTGNDSKFQSAKTQLEPFGIRLEKRTLPIIEIQSDSIKDIALDKAKKAFELLNQPLIVNDSGWFIPSLNGFPGPYMSYINQWFGPEDFLHLMEKKTDKTVILKQVVVYIDSEQIKVFENEQEGKFLNQASRVEGRSGDRVISFTDDGVSLAEKLVQGKYRVKSSLWPEFAEWYQSNLKI